MRILVADDGRAGRELISDLLALEGHTVYLAADGVEAVEKARDLLPDLVLMDIQMPRLDGIEATRRLRHDPATQFIPVVAMTAGASRYELEQALDAGCIGHLSKPIVARQVAAQVGAWLDVRATPLVA